MIRVTKNISKVLLSYLAILLVLMLMPIFLFTTDVSIMDSLVEFIFENKV